MFSAINSDSLIARVQGSIIEGYMDIICQDNHLSSFLRVNRFVWYKIMALSTVLNKMRVTSSNLLHIWNLRPPEMKGLKGFISDLQQCKMQLPAKVETIHLQCIFCRHLNQKLAKHNNRRSRIRYSSTNLLFLSKLTSIACDFIIFQSNLVAFTKD